MNNSNPYPVGTPGRKWGAPERAEWLARQSVERAYAQEVLAKIERLEARFDVQPYGALAMDPERYPLYVLASRDWDQRKPSVLVTGGVHGYETSGVQGAIRFLQTRAQDYGERFNLLVAPCVSPWGYETVNRWNPQALDPNRSFCADSECEEAVALMRFIGTLGQPFLAHFDLHETTDTDNTEFRPALSARDAVEHEIWHIPDGFYTVGDAEKPEPGFQAAIIRSVENITHIAPADDGGKIIGEAMEQRGVISYAARSLGLCMGLTTARFVTTTEVYPDSPRVDDEICTNAQVAAVVGGLDFIVESEPDLFASAAP